MGILLVVFGCFNMTSLTGIKFGEEFGNRYGQPIPAFFPGSLEDALGEVK